MQFDLDTFSDLDEVLFRNEWAQHYAGEQDARVLKCGKGKRADRRVKYLELHDQAAKAFTEATKVLEREILRNGR